MASYKNRLAPLYWSPKVGEKIGGIKGKHYIEGIYLRTARMFGGCVLAFIKQDNGKETGIYEIRPV